MTVWKSLAVGTLAVVGAIVGTFFIVGPDRIWALVGPPDLGPVVFETLERRTTPNDALACPPDICKARSDLVPPEYAVNARDLRAAFAKVLAAAPRLLAVATDDATLTDRYVQRSRLMRYPDTIVVRFLDRPQGRSTIALYSRSQLGRGDMSVNRTRLERWLQQLETYAEVVK